MRIRLGLVVAAAWALTLIGAPAAFADSSQSTNWAGYAIHRGGVRFTKVIGDWTQPRATCAPGTPTYSAVWVGLGGYSRTSQALEQIGTELDCTTRGRPVSSAWYEMVPSASHTTRLIIRPGDRVRASVSVTGKQVALVLDDLSRHRSFTKTVRASVLDVSSAEWIVEAPSVCTGAASCETLPLADFNAATISSATAESTTGHAGGIEDRHWGVSQISLFAARPRFITNGASTAASAVPSSVSRHGDSFTVTYRGGAGQTPTAEPARVTDGRLVHPRR